jgi:hypothetical protein
LDGEYEILVEKKERWIWLSFFSLKPLLAKVSLKI